MTTGVTPIEYKWKPGSRVDIDPMIAGKEFGRIAKRDGDVKPVALVDASRDPSAPLHSYFEWDNSAAAEQHREDQARKLLRSLVVVFVRNDTEAPQPPIRAMVRLKEAVREGADPPKSYIPINKVMSDVDLRDRYRRQAFNELCNWRDRYADIEDFARVFAEIDALKEQYKAG